MERRGIVTGMTNEDYHSGPEVSCSSLKWATRSLAHYQAYKKYGGSIGEKTALDGNICHTAILEPDQFDARYAVAPKCDKRTNAGKKLWADFQAAHHTQELITQEQYDMGIGTASSVSLSTSPYRIGQPETSIFWPDSESGLWCRVRPDWMTFDTIIDVKTTDDCRQFPRDCIKYGYHIQQAFYLHGCREAGIDIKAFIFLVVEKKAPYDFQYFRLDDDLVQAGADQFRQALNQIALAEFTGTWPGYDKEIQPVSKPSWL